MLKPTSPILALPTQSSGLLDPTTGGLRASEGTKSCASAPTQRMMPVALAAIQMLLGAPTAQALPSYARQTGQECAACHNGFPELTPYGRLFKLNGYTFGGGQSNLPALAVDGGPAPSPSTQAAAAARRRGAFRDRTTISPRSSPAACSTAAPSPAMSAPSCKGPTTTSERNFSWDNTDIRYAASTQLLGSESVFGVSANNNPTVTDLWNSTPAWGYPFLSLRDWRRRRAPRP